MDKDISHYQLTLGLVGYVDPDQADKAKRFAATGAWVSTVVLAEASWVLESVYGFDKSSLARAFEMLMNHKGVTIQDEDTVAAALIRFKASRGVGFADCLVLDLARKAGHLPLGTFDQKLAKLDGTQRL